MILEIVIPGKPISGNHAKRGTEVYGKQVRTDESVRYDKRIKSIAKAAAYLVGWKMPDYVRCDITIVGSRTDRDNVSKEVMDPIQGIAFVHDSRVLDGWIKRIKNDGYPRVVLQISAVDGADYGFAPPRRLTDFARCQAEARKRTANKRVEGLAPVEIRSQALAKLPPHIQALITKGPR